MRSSTLNIHIYILTNFWLVREILFCKAKKLAHLRNFIHAELLNVVARNISAAIISTNIIKLEFLVNVKFWYSQNIFLFWQFAKVYPPAP